MSIVITIDGPAASGKTSLSREVAKEFGWNWVSTGAFYRGLAYVASRNNIDLNNEQDLVQWAQSKNWKVQLEMEKTSVFYRNENVTKNIFKEEIGNLASLISQKPLVRSALLEAQRSLSQKYKYLIAEGRDCGTVVFPHAQLKFYVTASAEMRAQRRSLEQNKDFSDTLQEQSLRDQQDTQRATAPLSIPKGSYEIDTNKLSFEEVLSKVKGIIRQELDLS